MGKINRLDLGFWLGKVLNDFGDSTGKAGNFNYIL